MCDSRRIYGWRSVLTACLLAWGGHSAAQVVTGDYEARGRACEKEGATECGWHWGHIPVNNPFDKEPTPTPSPPPVVAPAEIPKAEVEIDCEIPEQWVTPCGFIDPAGNFDFQAKQRDALIRQMVMSVNDPQAVKEFQKYNRWVIDQAIQIANVWEYNLIQDPSMNPLVSQPTSTFGLKMLDRERNLVQEDTFAHLREEGAFLIFFSRSDCRYCHDMTRVVREVAHVTGLDLYNASLDGECLPYLNEDQCLTAPDTLDPATVLGITTVPDLILHIPSSDGWIRISTGVNTVDVLLSRVRIFTNSVRAAVENGIKNAQDFQPDMDFRTKANRLLKSGLGEGVTIPSTVAMEQ